MAELQKEESQKTVVSFIVGLLIGGLLVWAFSGTAGETPKPADTTDDTKTETPVTTNENKTDKTTSTESTKPATAVATLPVGDAEVSGGGQVTAGKSVPLDRREA